MKINEDNVFYSREARIIKSHYGIDFEDTERSAANVRKLEQLLLATYPTNEAASPVCPFLTIAEQAAINILQTRLVLKHKTHFNKELLEFESIKLCSGKDQVLQGLKQVKPSRMGSVFLSIGSSEHESPIFLNQSVGVTILIHNAVITQEGYLRPFWLSPHIIDMIKNVDFGKIFFLNSAKRMFYSYNKQQKKFPNGFKTYQYYYNDQLVVERTVPVVDECVSGTDIIPFLLRQFVLELRYLGGEYRSHVLSNLFDKAILNAAFDTIINTDSFEVSKPGVLHLSRSQCVLQEQIVWPVYNDDQLQKLSCNKYVALFRKGDKLTAEMIEKATQDGHQLFIKKLVKKGMPVNVCFEDNNTAMDRNGLLHLAVKYQQQQILNVLTAANVDVRLRDAKRRNISYYALMAGKVDNLIYALSLRTKYKHDHAIQFASNLNSHVYSLTDHPLYMLLRYDGAISEVPKLIQLGLRIDGHFGGMCLSILLMRCTFFSPGLANIIQQLIAGGADINYRIPVKVFERDGITPLMLAARKRLSPIVEMLIHHGAAINLRSHSYGRLHPNGLLGNTALMFAAEAENNHQVITLLLNAGADVSLCTRENKSAADYAVDPTYFPDLAGKRRKLVEEPPKPAVEEIGVGVAIVMGYDSDHVRYYCLGRRLAPTGQLVFPGGFFDIEQDRTLQDTSTRELCEETGLALKPVNDRPLHKKTEIQKEKCLDREFHLYNAGYIQHAPVFANDDLIDIAWVPELAILNRTVGVVESNLYFVQRLSAENRIPQQFPGRFFQQNDPIHAGRDANDQQSQWRLP